MTLEDLISSQCNPEQVKQSSGNKLVDFLKSVIGPKSPVSVDGYMKKADSDDFILFSDSPRSTSWVQISTVKVRELEYFGREFIPDGVCAKVRLTI